MLRHMDNHAKAMHRPGAFKGTDKLHAPLKGAGHTFSSLTYWRLENCWLLQRTPQLQ